MGNRKTTRGRKTAEWSETRAAAEGGKRSLKSLDRVNLNSSQLAQSGWVQLSSENKETQSWRGEEGGEGSHSCRGPGMAVTTLGNVRLCVPRLLSRALRDG